MPATPARIGFITAEFRRAQATTSAVQTRYGALARESEDPIVSDFDNQADAQTIVTARQALLSPERRRFALDISDVQEVQSLAYAGGAVPIGRYTDAGKNFDKPVLVSEIVIDLGRQSARVVVWG